MAVGKGEIATDVRTKGKNENEENETQQPSVSDRNPEKPTFAEIVKRGPKKVKFESEGMKLTLED